MKIHRAIKILFLAIVHAAALFLFARGVRAASGWEIVPAMLAGHLALDFFTLVVHFTVDNYFDPETPIIGDVVFYFREHHRAPMAMFARDYVDNNFENALIGLLFQVAAIPLALGPFLDVLVATGSLGSAYITLFHRWAHVDDPGPVARVLQRLHLVVDRAHHEVHHRGEGKHYGLAAGWLDGAAERVRLFETIEIVVRRLTGAAPLHSRVGVEERRWRSPA